MKLQCTEPVKFKGVETKTGNKNGKDWTIKEAKLFIPDLGLVRVIVVGNPKLPPEDTSINIALSVDQGSFQSIRVVWDESTQFKVV